MSIVRTCLEGNRKIDITTNANLAIIPETNRLNQYGVDFTGVLTFTPALLSKLKSHSPRPENGEELQQITPLMQAKLTRISKADFSVNIFFDQIWMTIHAVCFLFCLFTAMRYKISNSLILYDS